MRAIQSIASAHHESKEYKKLNMKKKTGGRNPVSAEIILCSVVLCILLHKAILAVQK
jgi:hypothetical protein